MSQAESNQAAWQSANKGSGLAFSIITRLLRKMESGIVAGRLSISLPSNATCELQSSLPGIDAAVTFRTWSSLVRTLLYGDIGFAEAFMEGDVSTPDLGKLLAFVLHNPMATDAVGLERPRPLRRLWHMLNRNTLKGSRRNIMAHYDLGNAFYAKWLDVGMNYSSAMFVGERQSLEKAQEQKLDRAIELLDLKPGQTVLEIGCGWGSLAERMARQRDVAVHGITLSPAQLAYAEKRLADNARVRISLCDYRKVAGQYDRIVSIEMLEAVGAEYWRNYFATIKSRLSVGGIAVLQVITIAEDRYESYSRNPDFIQKYIFPGGMLPTCAIIERECQAAGLALIQAEMFGQSYARTLAIWHDRFQLAWQEISRLGFDDRFRRTWEYYLKYCQAGFEHRAIDVGFFKIGSI